MGGRVEGKVKKKSIKADVTSKFSAKRKLSRMGKKVKKGQMGPNTEFITRSSALKRLQITLKDFRRLCILKGVYPRVPSKLLHGKETIYYDIKDISYIHHEPLLKKFRQFKTFMKKIKREAGRNQTAEARRKHQMKPQMNLDHLVKERYPRFIDALRDLDDALCMINLFAALPSVGKILATRTSVCNELVKHWMYYVAESRTLSKVFVSVKGIYYQAEIMGEPITWISPHRFTQSLPKEVDYRVMLTFLEFYEVFVKFVLFKLYHLQNMQYPPQLDKKRSESGAFLFSLKAKAVDSPMDSEGSAIISNLAITNTIEENIPVKVPKIFTPKDRLESLPDLLESIAHKDEMDGYESDDDVPIGEPLAAAFEGLSKHQTQAIVDQPIKVGVIDKGDETDEQKLFGSTESVGSQKNLFQNLVFFISREVPLDVLEFCLVSFGAKVGWDNDMSPYARDDPRITHQIVDRPQQQGMAHENSNSREYVQPQWVFDSINANLLLPITNYRPGVKLPPHLSPFVDDEKEGYLPKYKEEIRKLQGIGSQSIQESTDKGHEGASNETDYNENDYEDEMQSERDLHKKKEIKRLPAIEDRSEGSDDLKAEKKGSMGSKKGAKAVVYPVSKSKGVDAVAGQGANGEEDEDEDRLLSKVMMNKKTKRLYDRMQHGIEKRQSKINNLEEKRKQMEERDGETTLMKRKEEGMVGNETQSKRKKNAKQ